MNKEELLKAIEQKRQAIWPTDTGEMAPATVPNNLEQGWLNALKWMEGFIKSLPSEQPSKELEVEINLEYKSNNALMMPIGDFRKLIHHFTDWQKEQMMKGFCFETRVYQDCDVDSIESPFQTWLELEQNEITALPNIGLKEGDKVKILIIKEDEPNIVNIEPPSFEESQGEFNSYNVALNG